ILTVRSNDCESSGSPNNAWGDLPQHPLPIASIELKPVKLIADRQQIMFQLRSSIQGLFS
ncbi:MAG: hypothetical protein AAGM46_21050, partial [Cyanobacteria bacterium J06582_2]